MRISTIYPSGIVAVHEANLPPFPDALRKAVGGDIEYVRVAFNGKVSTMIVNETGAVCNPPLAPNPRATAIYWTATIQGKTPVPFAPLSDPMIHGVAVLLEDVRKEDL